MIKTMTIVLFLAGFAWSCEKDNPPVAPSSPGKYENGLLVLNEGLYQQNNASICYYSLETGFVHTQSFFTENDRGLGDTANDFEKYTLNGVDYLIVAVDVSSQVEILEANTLRSVAQIPLFDGTDAREPRRIKVYGTEAFVCNFDGTIAVIDLITNSLADLITVGANPDGMVAIDNLLYVSNSGGLNFPVYDSTVMIVNMNNHFVEDTIPTRINSSSMIVDAENDIYLISSGNYTSVDPALLRINTVTETVQDTWDLDVRYMTQVGDWIYYYDEELEGILRFNTVSETPEGVVVIDCSGYETFYGMQYEPTLGLLFCFDANGYVNSSVVRAYEFSGGLEFEFTAELNAKKISYNE